MAAVKRPVGGTSTPAPASRRDRARATRLRIITAAHALFVERGYTGTKMADVASAAGVAVQTVYFTFHTKSELLQACYEAAVLGPDDPKPPPQQPWWAELMGARTGAAALDAFAGGTTVIMSRVGALDDIVRSAAHEPDAVAVRFHSERLRRDGFERIADHLAATFGLADDLDVKSATDIMLTIASPATYRGLVLDYGWTDARYVRWLSRTLQQQLLRPRGHRSVARG